MNDAKLQQYIAEAYHDIAEAKKWGYSPDPYAQTIVELCERIVDLEKVALNE